VISSRGRSAYLEQDADFRWTVVVEPAPGAESQRFALEKEPSDRLRGLIGFVPGTDLLLGQAYYASNQAVMQGAQLFTFDTVSGERRDLAAMSPLGWNAVYAWRGEGPAARLAFIDSSGQMALPTLALFDLATGAVTHPLPQGVAAADPAWRPDGGALAFAASLLGETVPAEDASAYRLPGIYLMAADTGTVTALTQPPAGARDGLPTWAGGGSALLFARTFEDGRLEIHAVQPDGSGERLLVSGLRAECPIDDPGCPWGRWLAMAAR
jgi:Tol biopolymer transport system component